MSNKASWSIILVFGAILFIYSILAKNIYVGMLSLFIGLICEKFGYNILFKEHDDKRMNKIKEIKRGRGINE